MKKFYDKFILKMSMGVVLMVVSIVSFASGITIENGYVRESIPGNYMTSAYMTINNSNTFDVKLVGVTGDFSPMIEMHEHIMNNGMMRMREVEHITIPANGSVVLQPMGYHLMIFKLIEPLQDQTQVEMTLTFDRHDDLSITLPVLSIKNVSHQD